jgi:hypothetical protein
MRPVEQENPSLLIDIYKDRVSDYSDAAAPINNRHGGYIALDGKVVAETKQCCHCQAHYVFRKGSGTIRHFCPHCMQSTCGRKRCHPDNCRPWEKQMAMIEAKVHRQIEVDKWLSIR